jgi:hypothetical protein
MQRTLEEVAHALAIVAPIFVLRNGSPEALSVRFLLAGRFVRGAAALVGPDGAEAVDLVIQRGALEAGIAILRKTSLAKALRAEHQP